MAFFKKLIGKTRIPRFVVEALVFFGFLASTSNCPCCGQRGCPVGLAGLALVSGFFVFLKNAFLGNVKGGRAPDAVEAGGGGAAKGDGK